MDERMSFFWIIAIACWLAGTIIAYFGALNEIELFDLNASIFSIAIFVISVFVFSFLFFGKLAYVVIFFSGIVSGKAMQTNLFVGALSFIPIIASSFAGKYAGLMLNDDLHEERNFFLYIKEIILYLITAIIIALCLGIAKDFFPKFPKPETPQVLKKIFGG